MNKLNLKRLAVNQWMRDTSSSPFHTKVRPSCIFESLRQHHIVSSQGSNIFNSRSVFYNSFPVFKSLLSSLQLHQCHTASQYNMPPFVSCRVSIQWLPPGIKPLPPSEPTSTLVLSDAPVPGGTGRFVDIRINQCALTKPNDNTLSPTDIDWAIAGVCTSTPLNPENKKNEEIVYTRKASFLHEIDSRIVLDNSHSEYTDEGYMRPAADGSGDELEHAIIFNPAEGVLMACEERWTDPEVHLLPGRKHRECIIMRIQQSAGTTHKGQLLLLGSHMQAIVAGSSGEMHLQRWEYKDDEHDSGKILDDLGIWKLIASLGSQDIIPDPDQVLAGENLKVKNLVWEVVKKIEW